MRTGRCASAPTDAGNCLNKVTHGVLSMSVCDYVWLKNAVPKGGLFGAKVHRAESVPGDSEDAVVISVCRSIDVGMSVSATGIFILLRWR